MVSGFPRDGGLWPGRRHHPRSASPAGAWRHWPTVNRRFGRQATYVFNLQINPTNICGSGCTFCNYAASKSAPHAYVLEEPEIFAQVDAAGTHRSPYCRRVEPDLALSAQPGTGRAPCVHRFPGLHIKAYTAVEIDYFAKTAGLSESTVLDQLKAAGMDAMPGGGAEIFSDRLYRQHWKNKTSPEGWVRIHQLAHGKGIPTNATMLFGFGDTWKERIDHLFILRQAQDQSGGFSCFIPLPFQPGAGNFIDNGPTPLETLAVLAISRLVLDNIPHLKSYWPMTGLATGAAGLSWGADDMDGTISQEKIAHLAGAATPVGMARAKMEQSIVTAGFTPVERDGVFSAHGGVK
jgi:aminodeoxyfutalosine synthase